MTNRVYGVMLVVILCLGIGSCSREPAANGQPKATASQWEFKVVYIELHTRVQGDLGDVKNWEKVGSKLSEYYTSLGADGWEYVGLNGALYAVFKRPKK